MEQLPPSEVGACAVLAPGILCLEAGVATQMEQVLVARAHELLRLGSGSSVYCSLAGDSSLWGAPPPTLP